MVIKIVRVPKVEADTIEAHARAGDPDTSHEAAVFASTLQQVEQKVYEFLLTQGSQGATVDEIAVALGIQTETISPRMRPLVRKGRVIETDARRATFPKRVGRIVWVATLPL